MEFGLTIMKNSLVSIQLIYICDFNYIPNMQFHSKSPVRILKIEISDDSRRETFKSEFNNDSNEASEGCGFNFGFNNFITKLFC